jgi:hypothetical protein
MEIGPWAGIHWVDLLQSASIIVGLLYTAYTVRVDLRERKIHSLLAVTAAHRDIWSKLYEHPHLAKVLQTETGAEPPTVSKEEELFVRLLILHLAASYRARKLWLFVEKEGFEFDVREFFSLPIPKLVWQKTRVYQERDFVAFVESSM